MLDDYEVDQLRQKLVDRFTPEELIELLGVSVGEVFDKFIDEILELDMDEVL